MEAKELRIGNWVYWNKNPQEVTLNSFGTEWSKSDGRSLFKELNPIPITEEWLLKFGFVKDKKNNNCCDLKLENDFYLQGVGYGKSNIKYEVILTDSSDNELTLVKHLHQLQNLYFSLTGNELTL